MEVTKKHYDEINEVESWLYEYKSIKASIVNLKEDLEQSKDITLGSADPSKELIITNKISSTVENNLLRRELLRDRMEFMENKIKKLDRAIDSLNEQEKSVINNFYIEGKRIYEFTHKIGTTERNCIRIKKRAIYKIRLALFGMKK